MPICTTASDGRSGDVESEAVQLKLLRQQMYSTKIDPLFEDSEDMQSIFTKGHMKSSLELSACFCLLTAPHGQI